MNDRRFEVHYCPVQQKNICVEAVAEKKRCLYENTNCPGCPFQENTRIKFAYVPVKHS